MGEFKVGDRVRATTDAADIVTGSAYMVDRVDEDDDRFPVRVVDDAGDGHWMHVDSFELVASPKQPAFKVGDRVRMLREVDGLKAKCEATVADIDGERSRNFLLNFDEKQQFAHNASGSLRDGHGWWVDFDDIELIDKPLRIEAGKFYKTRDGRKVGPMVKAVFSGWYDEMRQVTSQNWNDDGSYINGTKTALDLIAEWSEPAGKVAAQVDVQRDEYGGGAKPKFKVGDRVRFLTDNPDGGKRYGAKGALARVKRLFPSGGIYGSDMDVEPIGWECAFTPSAPSHAVELISPTAPAIVILKEDGVLKPATRTFVHDSRELAEAEAKRLASTNQGKEFGVYELVATAHEERVYEHEWQRLAAAGKKIDAIRELRRLTGIMLKPAKDAVESFLEVENGVHF